MILSRITASVVFCLFGAAAAADPALLPGVWSCDTVAKRKGLSGSMKMTISPGGGYAETSVLRVTVTSEDGFELIGAKTGRWALSGAALTLTMTESSERMAPFKGASAKVKALGEKLLGQKQVLAERRRAGPQILTLLRLEKDRLSLGPTPEARAALARQGAPIRTIDCTRVK